MDTNEQIESLDDVNNTTAVSNEVTLGQAVDATANSTNVEAPSESLDAAPTVQAPEPINLADVAAPTDLNNANIDSFNQQGISLENDNQIPKPSSLENVMKSEEYNDIGKVPPSNNKKEEPTPKKKKKKKATLIFIVILLIIGIGAGLYFYLGLGNKNKLTLKNVKVNVSDSLSTNVSDYVSIGTPDSSCITNFDEVNVNKVGSYPYKVVCNRKTYNGTIEVVDGAAPTIYLKNPIVYVNDEVSIDDFVENCVDEDCSYSFVNEEEVKTNLQTVGNYEVKIRVSDGNDNSKEVSAYLVVVKDLINRELLCTSNSIDEEGNNYSYVIEDNVPIAVISSSLAYSGFTIRNYILTYSTNDSYKEAVKTIKEDGSIETDIASGLANYIDSENKIIVTSIKTKDDMISEFTDYPEAYSDLRNKYENDERSFECVVN